MKLELHKIYIEQTKEFIDAIKEGKSESDLSVIRDKIKKTLELIDQKKSAHSISASQKPDNSPSEN